MWTWPIGSREEVMGVDQRRPVVKGGGYLDRLRGGFNINVEMFGLIMVCDQNFPRSALIKWGD